MKRNPRIFRFLVPLLLIAALGGCSSKPAEDSKKAAITFEKIQGKAQVLVESTGASDAALNAGGPSVYIWEGTRRYRLFLGKVTDVTAGKEYVAEGVFAQKAIDEIGDPAQGKNGYPLQASCERVVRMAWPGLPFDVNDGRATLLRARVKRYPARPVFLTAKIRPATEEEIKAAAKDKKAGAEDEELPEITVPPEKQAAALIEGPKVHTAPLWEPAGGTVTCKLIIGPDGKVAELDTGAQLCEAVPWTQFRYQPPLQKGKPVRVKTAVEVKFDPRA